VSAQKVIFISANGDDANSCGKADPCQTVTRAEQSAQPGDTVQMGAGVYAGAITLTKSGTEARKITYRGHSGQCASTPNRDLHAPATRPNPSSITDGWIVEASHIVIDCFRIRPKTVALGVSITGVGKGRNAAINRSYIDVVNNYVEFDGVNCAAGISLVSSGALASMSTHIQVVNNFITGCAYGVSIRATNSLVKDNEVYKLRAWDGAGDMDYMRLFGTNLHIRGNYLHGSRVADCNGEECHIDCFQTFNLNGSDWARLQNVVIDANTCFNAHQGILMQDVSRGNPGRPSGSHDHITVTNNVIGLGPEGSSMVWCMLFNSITNVSTFHNTCVSGQVRYRANSTAVHRNNLHRVETKSPAASDGTGSVTISDNLFYNPSHVFGRAEWPDNILNINPLFVDAANHDYRLSPNSPAIKAGASLGVREDRNATPRPTANPDIGAYQWSIVPAPPSNLTAEPRKRGGE
jgi:hypothetical protein